MARHALAKPCFDPFPLVEEGCDLLVLAGEHSGDEHASEAVERLKRLRPDLRVCAMGGPRLAAAGATLLCDMTSWSVVGFVEVVKNYGFFKRLFAETLAWIDRHRPRCICLVDYPGFNLRLAAELKRRGLSRQGGGDIAVVMYISPQIWAWKSGRRFKMAEVLDSLGVIFPFEVPLYEDTDLTVRFLGHPFAEPGRDLGVRYDPEGPVLLLPGSRPAPVGRILPPLAAGFAEWKVGAEETRTAVVVTPGSALRERVEQILGQAGASDIAIRENRGEIAGAVVLTSSGTMSLKCALAGIPGAIVYRAHPLTFAIGKRLAKVRYLGIANILLDRPHYPEYLQALAKPAPLAGEIADCLEDPQRRRDAADGSAELYRILGEERDCAVEDWLAEFVGE